MTRNNLYLIITLFFYCIPYVNNAQASMANKISMHNMNVIFSGDSIPTDLSKMNIQDFIDDYDSRFKILLSNILIDSSFQVDTISILNEDMKQCKILYEIEELAIQRIHKYAQVGRFPKHSPYSIHANEYITYEYFDSKITGHFVELKGKISIQSLFGSNIYDTIATCRLPIYCYNGEYLHYTQEINEDIKELFQDNYQDFIQNYTPLNFTTNIESIFKSSKIQTVLKDNSLKEEFKIFERINITSSTNSKWPREIHDALEATVQIRVDNGHGSGCIISSDGFIVTNYHVVIKSKRLKVILNSSQEFEARLIAQDPEHDLAIIKIETEGLATFNFGDIPQWGEPVWAIGSPLDPANLNSLSNGIMSGMAKNANSELIVTNVGINGGNSGGALVDSNMNLVGIVVSKIQGFTIEGLGMAIPTKYVQEFITKLGD